MINVTPISSSGAAAEYYAKDNYYTADQQHDTSAWAGEGAAALGLEGAVETAAFERVLAGELPNGDVLDAKQGDHRAGWDITMSVPKSVSILALIGGDRRLVDAVRTAAAATLGWVERNLAEARTWNGRSQEVERTGKLVAATFVHDVNRNGEPQFHVHNVVANATQTADGKWRALRPDELFNRQKVMGAVFNAELRARVEELGYATGPAMNPVNGAFEIVGVSRAAVEAFSTRSAEIAAELTTTGRQGSPRERELAALATRSAKTLGPAPELRGKGWRALAAAHGVDAAGLVAAAQERAGRGETVWSRAVESLRGIGERGLAIAARMGLTPRDGDPLVPERLGRLEPRAYAAAQAVASAVRDLGEREAVFDRLNLTRAALEVGGPVTVTDVEARVALLESKGRLIGDSDRLMTTQTTVELEKSYLAQVEAGIGKSAPIIPRGEAGVRSQDAARDLGLQRLNEGQEAAAVLMLSSSDRVVNVQGGAGRGKSYALAPVTAIAKAEGRNVIGVATASKTARELGEKTGATTSTIAGFLARHARVIDGTASAKQVEHARAELTGSVLIVEEASQVGTRTMERLARLANMMDVARLIQTGDVKQLGSVDAGKPYEESQRAGHATAHITENLRSASEQMKATTAALDKDDIQGAFDVLRPATIETDRSKVAELAARLWTALPPEERDQTLLLASGRAMRTAANIAVQSELKIAGEIASKGVRMEVLDRVTVTKEGARQMKAYTDGRVVEFRTDLNTQGFTRGDRGVVIGAGEDRARLRMRSGTEREFRPGKLPRNLKQDAVSVYATKSVELHRGDRIRWTDNDHDRGLANADLGRVEEVGRGKLTISSLADGTTHELRVGDRMLERLDLAYAVNVHVAQGVTAKHGIVVMSSHERMLSNAKSFLVAMTRIADKATLVVDDGRKLGRAVMRNPGEKTSALEMLRGKGDEIIRMPDVPAAIQNQIDQYVRSSLEVERAREIGRLPATEHLNRMYDAESLLDRHRPHGTEDLRTVMDRSPKLARDLAQGRSEVLVRAWSEAGRARTDRVAYADRFVADWRVASTQIARAGDGPDARKAEERMERLGERMGREPELERALNAHVPDRQRGVEDQAMNRVRDRDMEMGR